MSAIAEGRAIPRYNIMALLKAFRISNFYDLFRRMMQPLDLSALVQEKVIAHGHEHLRIGEAGTGMDADIHVAGEFHRFVAADQRPLDNVVTLAVAVQTLLLWKPITERPNPARARTRSPQNRLASTSDKNAVYNLGFRLQ